LPVNGTLKRWARYSMYFGGLQEFSLFGGTFSKLEQLWEP